MKYRHAYGRHRRKFTVERKSFQTGLRHEVKDCWFENIFN
jgi:hypothetical protein